MSSKRQEAKNVVAEFLGKKSLLMSLVIFLFLFIAIKQIRATEKCVWWETPLQMM